MVKCLEQGNSMSTQLFFTQLSTLLLCELSFMLREKQVFIYILSRAKCGWTATRSAVMFCNNRNPSAYCYPPLPLNVLHFISMGLEGPCSSLRISGLYPSSIKWLVLIFLFHCLLNSFLPQDLVCTQFNTDQPFCLCPFAPLLKVPGLTVTGCQLDRLWRSRQDEEEFTHPRLCFLLIEHCMYCKWWLSKLEHYSCQQNKRAICDEVLTCN